MRRKRFKHQVHTFCHMFLGWQLAMDLDELGKLESGTLEIDVKTGKCIFGGKEITKLSMPEVLNGWFLSDLEEHSISLSLIDSATLTVDFEMNNWGKKSGPRTSPEFHCKSELVSEGVRYNLEYKGEHSENEVKIT